MKRTLALTLTLMAFAPLANAATVLSQNWDTDPVNYTLPGISNPFRFQVSDPTRYWGPTSMVGVTPNAGVVGASGFYLGAQNMNNDGDGTLAFDTNGLPGQVEFTVTVSDFTNLQLSVALAGMPTAEVENYLRAEVDLDGDAFYETTLFAFTGGVGGVSNTQYQDLGPNLLGDLSGEFRTVLVNLPQPGDGTLRLRFSIFNDTNSQNEAHGVDTILITGDRVVPEPSSAVLGLAALALGFRRRR